MKPFLCTDLTKDKKNECINGEEFLVAAPSDDLAQSLERFSEKADVTIEQSKLFLPLRVLQWICGAFVLLFAVSVMKGFAGKDGFSFRQGYANAPGLFWAAGICLLVWGILYVLAIKKQKNVLGNEESDQIFLNLEGVCQAIYSELSVPADAKEVDLLNFMYQIKGDRMKVCEKPMQTAPYFNSVFRIFADSENLYFANLGGKYAFPMSSLVSIHTVKKNIRIMGWNKEESFNAGIYKQYKIKDGQYGDIHCKWYHILEINRDGEAWGVYIPCYELPIFEELTGLKAQ